jgi:hypothetical protein
MMSIYSYQNAKLLLLFIVRMDFAPSVQHHRRLRANARPITLNPLNQGVKKEYRDQTIK